MLPIAWRDANLCAQLRDDAPTSRRAGAAEVRHSTWFASFPPQAATQTTSPLSKATEGCAALGTSEDQPPLSVKLSTQARG